MHSSANMFPNKLVPKVPNGIPKNRHFLLFCLFCNCFSDVFQLNTKIFKGLNNLFANGTATFINGPAMLLNNAPKNHTTESF